MHAHAGEVAAETAFHAGTGLAFEGLPGRMQLFCGSHPARKHFTGVMDFPAATPRQR